MEVKKMNIEEVRKLGVEGERSLLLGQYMEEYQKNILPPEAELIPKEMLFLEVSDLYEELLKVEYEKNRLAAYVCASGNFSLFAQYCQDTEGTTSSEYATVFEEIASKEMKEDEEYVEYEAKLPETKKNLS